MTKREFENLTGSEICDELYNVIERIYNETSLTEQQFVEEIKKMKEGVNILESNIVTDMLLSIERGNTLIKEWKTKIDASTAMKLDTAEILIEKSCKYSDIDLYNKAVELIGINSVIAFKIKNNLPLRDSDQIHLLNVLENK